MPGYGNREPELASGLGQRYARISKADWMEIARDLYLQFEGETMTDEEFMQDAERRLKIIKGYRKAGYVRG